MVKLICFFCWSIKLFRYFLKQKKIFYLILKNCFFILAFFSQFAWAETLSIKSENKILLKDIKNALKNSDPTIEFVRNFLVKNSYFSAELIQDSKNILIKKPYKIIFVFKDNKFFTDQKLRKLIKIDSSKIGSFFYNFIEKSIKQAYRSEGFLQVKIEKIEEKRDWKKWIFINISEGPRIIIGDLKVRGLLSKPSSYYEKFIIDNSTRRIKLGVYNKKDLEKGYQNLNNHLKSEGYLQSKIYSDRVFFKEDSAFITVNLEEGPLVFIRDIQIKNVNSIPVWEILSHIKSRIQSTLKVNEVEKDLNRIEDLYRSKGYMQVKIKNKKNVIKYTPGSRYADIVIDIDEGSKAFISKITFLGLKKGSTKVS